MPEDGDEVTATSLNNVFDSSQTWLGSITRAGLRRGTFNRFHAASVLQNSTGHTVYAEGLLMQYDLATFGASMDWVSWGHDGGSGDAGDLGTADRAIVGHESTSISAATNPALITFASSGFHIGMDNGDRVAFVLVMFNCQVMDEDSKVFPFDPSVALSFSIQYEMNASGTWTTIQRSERFVSLVDHIGDPSAEGEILYYDVPISVAIGTAVLQADGFDPAVDKITAVRAMVTAYHFNVAPGSGAYFNIGNWRLSAIPIMAEDI